MLAIRNSAAMTRALDSPIDPRVKRLLTTRRDQLLEYVACDLGELAHWIVVAPGDQLAAIETEAGFPIAPDLPWEWVLSHDGIMEAPIILSDDGFGVILIVPDQQGVDPLLLALLREQAISAEPIMNRTDEAERSTLPQN